MKFTAEMIAKAKEAKSAAELLDLAKANGIAMTEKEADEYFAKLNAEGELADAELDNVAGGGCGGGGLDIKSKDPRCPKCGNWLYLVRTDWDAAGDHDLFTCHTCNKNYKHYWTGDKWTNA